MEEGKGGGVWRIRSFVFGGGFCGGREGGGWVVGRRGEGREDVSEGSRGCWGGE